MWTELDCIGYIPVAREGHSAAIVNDTMYIFGGRTQEGIDLGDLAAFRITSRRWYMFQNMGHSPSPRSGHSMTAFGKHIVTLAGEPSSSASDKNELSLSYILDTSKIRYPPNETAPPPQQPVNTPRKMSGGERSNIPQGKAGTPAARESMMAGAQQAAMSNGMGAASSRLPRAAGPPPLQQPPQQPPQQLPQQSPQQPLQQPPQQSLQQPPQSRGTPPVQVGAAPRSKTPTKNERSYGSPVDTDGAAPVERGTMSPAPREVPPGADPRKPSEPPGQRTPKESIDSTRSASVGSRNASRSQHRAQPSHDRQLSHDRQVSVDSFDQGPPMRMETPQQRNMSRETDHRPTDSGFGASPAVSQPNDETVRELDMAKSRNAWYASELALARKAGYNPGTSTSPMFDERSADSFQDEDKPLLEALLRMKTEVERVQNSIKTQGEDAAKRIAEVERQRDAAISEAIYAKTKLAAHGGGSRNATPQPDGTRNTGTPDMERMNDISKRLAASLAAQAELSATVQKLSHEVEAERKAKQLADETAEAAQARVQELDSTRQKAAAESESLRAELHEAERTAREVSVSAAEAETSSKLLAVDKQELSTKVARILAESVNYAAVLETLRSAVAASSEKSTLLEKQLEEERTQSENTRQKLGQLRAEHEARTTELEVAAQKLRDAEELAEKYAEESRLHQQAVLSGLGQISARAVEDDTATDERVTILHQQVESANFMARKNQAAADQASEKLRRAEERIAGLESYQEQSSREGLTIRKQLQQAMRDMQTAEAEKAELTQQHERLRLESNAFEVQLKTLKNLLEERGVNAVDARRSRVVDSPSSRFGTPELNRARELERQVDSMNKSNEELRAAFEQREHDVSKEWEEKLQALHNDHQAAVKYLRGTEKMLAKMKQELDRYKTANSRLEEELSQARQASRSPTREQTAEWDAERAAHQSTVARLEGQLSTLQSELTAARAEVEEAAKTAKQAEANAESTRTDLETLRRQHVLVEERAREAENRVQMFLDQFESSVDSYRRQSTAPVESINGDATRQHRTHDSIASAESLYSTDGTITPDANNRRGSTATRNSMALDNLASELDALRSHWETTNKAYRLSDRFDFDREGGGDKNGLGSLAQWPDEANLADDAAKHSPNTTAPQAQAMAATTTPAAAPPASSSVPAAQ
jgi:chromosome segregation ATPase